MSDEFNDTNLKVSGSEYGGNQFREALLIEFHMNRVAALAAQDLSETEIRSSFKNGLAGLESLLANYHDELYEKDMDDIRGHGIGEAGVEIHKCFKWFSILKRLLSRTGIYKTSIPQLLSEEENGSGN